MGQLSLALHQSLPQNHDYVIDFYVSKMSGNNSTVTMDRNPEIDIFLSTNADDNNGLYLGNDLEDDYEVSQDGSNTGHQWLHVVKYFHVGSVSFDLNWLIFHVDNFTTWTPPSGDNKQTGFFIDDVSIYERCNYQDQYNLL